MWVGRRCEGEGEEEKREGGEERGWGRRERGGEGVVRVKWRRWKREVEPSIIHVLYMHHMRVKSPVRFQTNTQHTDHSHYAYM